MSVRTLLMLPNNPGDVLMATPAIRALKKKGEEVHFLVDADAEGLVTRNPHIDRLHVLPRRRIKAELSGAAWKSGVRKLKGFAEELKQAQFNRVINLFQGPVTAILSSMIPCDEFQGARLRRNGTTELCGELPALLYSVPYARRHAPAHAADFYCLICGVRPDGRGPDLVFHDASVRKAEAALKKGGLDPARLAVLHPCSAHLKKEWPHDHYAALLNRLCGAGWSVALTGSLRERDRVEALLAKAGKPAKAINLCGALTFLESAAVIRRAAAVVSGDTVAMHIAAAVGAKTITVFAPTSPLETGPYAAGAVCYAAECLCRGHYEGYCPSGKLCTGRLSPEAVFEEIEGRIPEVPAGLARLTAAFDDRTGFIDYLNNGRSVYSAAARALLMGCAGDDVPSDGLMPPADEQGLRSFRALLQANCTVLKKLTEVKNQEDARPLLAENAGVERALNVLPGLPALFSAFLRFRNNAVVSENFGEIVSAFHGHGQGLLTAADAVLSRVKVREEAKDPSVKAFFLFRGREEDAREPLARLAGDLAAPGITVEAAEDKGAVLNRKIRECGADLVLLVDKTVRPPAGLVRELAQTLALEPDAAAAVPKLLRADDTLQPALFEVTGRREFRPWGAGLKRFDPNTTLFREAEVADFVCVLLDRAAFLAAGGFDEAFSSQNRDFDFCLKCRSLGRKILYAPEAEVYVEEAAAKPPAEPGAEGDRWRLMERWKQLPCFNRTPEEKP